MKTFFKYFSSSIIVFYHTTIILFKVNQLPRAKRLRGLRGDSQDTGSNTTIGD